MCCTETSSLQTCSSPSGARSSCATSGWRVLSMRGTLINHVIAYCSQLGACRRRERLDSQRAAREGGARTRSPVLQREPDGAQAAAADLPPDDVSRGDTLVPRARADSAAAVHGSDRRLVLRLHLRGAADDAARGAISHLSSDLISPLGEGGPARSPHISPDLISPPGEGGPPRSGRPLPRPLLPASLARGGRRQPRAKSGPAQRHLLSDRDAPGVAGLDRAARDAGLPALPLAAAAHASCGALPGRARRRARAARGDAAI
mmetsp:Transcript_4751/g.15433  ORF Transcript_4751/g.15433 Transcript_4751/m.15433 type:complete len:261 (+) Transcript_4751:599-1381(+)